MKLSEVVNQLQVLLPKRSDAFSSIASIATITAVGGVATIETNVDHNLATSEAVTIADVAQENKITSIDQDGLVFTIGVENDHDLTFGFDGYENVNIGGFADPNWNGSFKLIAVIDRKTFKIQSTNALPALSGQEYLSEIRIDGVNGRYSVTVTTLKEFTIAGDFLDGEYNGGKVQKGVRIAGTVSIARALKQYTKQEVEDLWMFVVMNNAVASKNRTAESDATATVANGEDIRLRLIDGFSLYIVKNVKDDIAAVNAMDLCRHDLLSPILKSLFGARFSTGLSGSADFGAILTGHRNAEYDRATFVYEYGFEFSTDLINEDTVEQDDTKAFSRIDYSQSAGDTAEPLTFSIDF